MTLLSWVASEFDTETCFWKMSETLTVEKTGKGEEKARTINRERFISKIFLRGDSVIVILMNQRLARCFFARNSST